MEKKFKISNTQLYAAIGLGIVFILDLFIPLGVAVGALYLLCFFIINRESKNTILTFALIIFVLILFKLLIFYSSDTNWMVLVNRGISVFVIFVAALLALEHRKLYEITSNEKIDQILKLEAANNRLKTIQEAIETHLIVSISNTEGSIIYVNQNLCNISKYHRGELIGKNHRIFKSGEHADHFYKELWNSITSGKPWNGEVKNKAKDGSFFWCNAIIIPYIDHRKKIHQYLAIWIPITERKALEKKQEEHIQSLEKILHDISHKLRSPIATCLGLTQLLEYKKNSSSEVLDLAIEHRKTCANDLTRFAQEISAYIYQQTKDKI